MEQEKVYYGEEYKKYIRSFSFFGKYLFLFMTGVLLILLCILAWSHETPKNNFLIGIVGIFILIALFMMYISFYSAADMIKLKVKVQIAETVEVSFYKNNKWLVYMYKGKPNRVNIPRSWDLGNRLHQKIKIWLTYHTESVLRIEFLESGEVLDVNKMFLSKDIS